MTHSNSMKTVLGSEVGGTSLPDMKTTYHRCCRSVFWATLNVHLLTPPRERTLGTKSGSRLLRKKTSTLAVDFISCEGRVFTLYAMSMSIISTAGMA